MDTKTEIGFFKKYSGIVLIIISSIIPFFLWFPSVKEELSILSLGQILALTGVVLFSINFILSGRFKFLEPLFNGLNRMYIIHHLVGEVALLLLLLHPMFIIFYYLKFSVEIAFSVLFPPLSDFPVWLGIAALTSLVTLLILTIYIKIPYHIWKLTHKFLGLSLFLASLHIFFIPSTVSINLPLRYYILGFCTLGLLSYMYRTLLGRYLVKRYKYKVIKVNLLHEVTEIILSPLAEKMKYDPGQFIFINFASLEVSKEEHPFSLTSNPVSDEISISPKSVGDYTRTVKLLKPGTLATVEGPFGAFSYKTKPRKDQVWIAGGIGITPFISMAKSFDPKNGYHSYLYYVVTVPEEAVYLNLLKNLSKLNNNLVLIPVITSSTGRITAEAVYKNIPDLKKRDILICGPLPMMKSLREQFNNIGIRNSHIFTEEFSIN